MSPKYSTRTSVLALAFVAALAAADIKAPGVPSFHQVDEHVYRGGQPTAEGLRSLAKLGIKTVIDLRAESSVEKKTVESLGMRYINIPMHGMTAPSDEQIARALALLEPASASNGWPAFVHCRRGKDRTGTVIACYRILHDRWDQEKALQEARMLGMAWVERAMQNYILHFDPAQKNLAGLTPAKVSAGVP